MNKKQDECLFPVQYEKEISWDFSKKAFNVYGFFLLHLYWKKFNIFLINKMKKYF